MHVREARQRAVHFEHVANGEDTLRGVGARAVLIDSAERIVVEAARWEMSKTQSLSEGLDSRKERMAAAYFRFCSVELVSSALPNAFAPSPLDLLPSRL